MDGRILQVECKQCGGRHRYKPDAQTARDSASKSSLARPARSGTSRPASGRRTKSAPHVVTANPDRPPRPYAPAEAYSTGDRVVHPRFGEGVVQAVTGPTRVRVLFVDGEKTLVHGRARS